MTEAINRGQYDFSPINTDFSSVNMAFVRAMCKEGTGNDKQRKDEGNRTLCPYRNFSQAITVTDVKRQCFSKVLMWFNTTSLALWTTHKHTPWSTERLELRA